MPTYESPYGTTLKYASENEVLEFANAVRKAGGGNVISALLPAHPGQTDSCLIARALNFSCKIIPDEDHKFADGSQRWLMVVETDELARKIAKKCHLRTKRNDDCRLEIILPKRIGNVAATFDDAAEDYQYDYESDTYTYPDVWPMKYVVRLGVE